MDDVWRFGRGALPFASLGKRRECAFVIVFDRSERACACVLVSLDRHRYPMVLAAVSVTQSCFFTCCEGFLNFLFLFLRDMRPKVYFFWSLKRDWWL